MTKSVDGSTIISIVDVARELNVPVPDEFICPITLEVMTCPVTTKYGLTFDRRAIKEWLHRNSTCPLTRQPLTLNDLVPNQTLQTAIVMWVWFHCLPLQLRTVQYTNGNYDLIVCPPQPPTAGLVVNR